MINQGRKIALKIPNLDLDNLSTLAGVILFIRQINITVDLDVSIKLEIINLRYKSYALRI